MTTGLQAETTVHNNTQMFVAEFMLGVREKSSIQWEHMGSIQWEHTDSILCEDKGITFTIWPTLRITWSSCNVAIIYSVVD